MARQSKPPPSVSLQIEQVVGEHRLAFEQVEPYPAKRTAHVAIIPSAPLGNGDLGRDSGSLLMILGAVPTGMLEFDLKKLFCSPGDRTWP